MRERIGWSVVSCKIREKRRMEGGKSGRWAATGLNIGLEYSTSVSGIRISPTKLRLSPIESVENLVQQYEVRSPYQVLSYTCSEGPLYYYIHDHF